MVLALGRCPLRPGLSPPASGAPLSWGHLPFAQALRARDRAHNAQARAQPAYAHVERPAANAGTAESWTERSPAIAEAPPAVALPAEP
jgi:hypothetical protein